MKSWLIVGDSLAGGLPHNSFPAVLEKMLPGCTVRASAAGGDTLAGIVARAQRLLARSQPDVLVLEAGTNDVLLPLLKGRGGRWRLFVRMLERRGSVPAADGAAFRELYSRAVAGAMRQGVGAVVLVTIACVGEDLASEANRIREEYNAAIRDIGAEHGARIADAGRRFEELLSRAAPPGGYVFGGFGSMFTDTLHCLTARGSHRLSERRGLILTIDGVHLNPLGAGVYAEEVLAAACGNERLA